MKAKKESCKYCGEKMSAKTTRAEFCSNKCRVYWNRENPKVNLKNFNASNKTAKPITEQLPKSNYVVNIMPEKEEELTAFQIYQRKKLGLK